MTFRKPGRFFTEVVVARETAHVGRVLKLTDKQAKMLVGLFFGGGRKFEVFKKAVQDKMPELGSRFPLIGLHQYLANVFG